MQGGLHAHRLVVIVDVIVIGLVIALVIALALALALDGRAVRR